MVKSRHLRTWLPAFLGGMIAAGCNQPIDPSMPGKPTVVPETEKLKIVTTFLPVYWFTKAVAGDKADIEILIPPGTDIHEYQATPANVKALAQADVLVKNGLGLEEFLKNTVKNAQNPLLIKVDASAKIQPLENQQSEDEPDDHSLEQEHSEGDSHDHAGEETHSSEKSAQADKDSTGTDHGHDHNEGPNPHVWVDPVLAKQQVEAIRDGLIEADPLNKQEYQANAASYIQQLEQLDQRFKNRLEKYPNCTFVTFHNAFPYLANRYQLKQVAVVNIPEGSLSPAEIQKTIDTVKQANVKAVFGEPGIDNKLLQNLSDELNLKLSTLDSLESGPLDPQHYFKAMRNNLQTIESACKEQE